MSTASDAPPDDEWVPPGTETVTPRKSRAVGLGAALGAALFWVLAVAEVTVVVAEWRDEKVGFGYRVRVLGAEVYGIPRIVPYSRCGRGRRCSRGAKVSRSARS